MSWWSSSWARCTATTAWPATSAVAPAGRGRRGDAGGPLDPKHLTRPARGRSGVPREVLVPELPPDAAAVEEWLSARRGSRVRLRVPQRGDKKALLDTVTRNAGESLALHKTRRASDLTTRSRALHEIQEALGLDEAPLRIECYDVSNLMGTHVVASMVVFEDGLARKSEYRRFSIRGGGDRRRRVDLRGHHPPVPPLPGRTGADRRAGHAGRHRRRRRAGQRRRGWPGRASSPTRPTWW